MTPDQITASATTLQEHGFTLHAKVHGGLVLVKVGTQLTAYLHADATVMRSGAVTLWRVPHNCPALLLDKVRSLPG